jgi:ketosteroid isomerase-like protein
MTTTDNVSALKAAYAVWHDRKGADTSAWLALMDDDFRIASMGDEGRGLAFVRERTAKVQAVEYLSSLTRDWTMIHFTPETYVADGDQVAMFGKTAWTNKATGKVAEVRTAHLWRFRNGKAIELIEIFDSARVVAAATP